MVDSYLRSPGIGPHLSFGIKRAAKCRRTASATVSPCLRVFSRASYSSRGSVAQTGFQPFTPFLPAPGRAPPRIDRYLSPKSFRISLCRRRDIPSQRRRMMFTTASTSRDVSAQQSPQQSPFFGEKLFKPVLACAAASWLISLGRVELCGSVQSSPFWGYTLDKLGVTGSSPVSPTIMSPCGSPRARIEDHVVMEHVPGAIVGDAQRAAHHVLDICVE